MDTQTKKLHTSPQIAYKFFRKKLELSEFKCEEILRSRIKRPYINEISCLEFEGDLKHRLNKKQLKLVTKFAASVAQENYFLRTMQYPRHLKETFLRIMEDGLNIEQIVTYLQRGSKNLKVLKLLGEDIYLNPPWIHKLHKTIGASTKLETLEYMMNYINDKGAKYVEKEMTFMNQYLTKLNKLKEVKYEQDEFVQIGFQAFLKKDIKLPFLTDLTMHIAGDVFSSFDQVRNQLKEEMSEADQDKEVREQEESKEEAKEDNEDDWSDEEADILGLPEMIHGIEGDDNYDDSEYDENEDDMDEESDNDQDKIILNTEEEKVQAIKSEMVPFFRFDLFPKLKNLTLGLEMECLYPLGSFVIEGFKALNKLQKLDLRIETRPIGTKFFFEGFLHLPPLSTFNLDISFIRVDEAHLLAQFFQKQPSLESLLLNIPESRKTKAGYQAQNLYLENIWQFLNNKPNLKNLTLTANHWTLESLSKGLGKTLMENQLENITIKVFDDFLSSSSPPLNRVKGLIDFIQRQKSTLKKLSLNIKLENEGEIGNSFLEAISHLESLERLSLNIHNLSKSKHLTKFLNKHFANEIPQKALPKSDTFNQFTINQLGKVLKAIKNISSLRISLSYIDPCQDPLILDFSEALSIIPSLKNAKKISLLLPFLKESVCANPYQVSPLETLSPDSCSVYIRSYNGKKHEEVDEISRLFPKKNRFINIEEDIFI